jgi:hypothetical protein
MREFGDFLGALAKVNGNYLLKPDDISIDAPFEDLAIVDSGFTNSVTLIRHYLTRLPHI